MASKDKHKVPAQNNNTSNVLEFPDEFIVEPVVPHDTQVRLASEEIKYARILKALASKTFLYLKEYYNDETVHYILSEIIDSFHLINNLKDLTHTKSSALSVRFSWLKSLMYYYHHVLHTTKDIAILHPHDDLFVNAAIYLDHNCPESLRPYPNWCMSTYSFAKMISGNIYLRNLPEEAIEIMKPYIRRAIETAERLEQSS